MDWFKLLLIIILSAPVFINLGRLGTEKTNKYGWDDVVASSVVATLLIWGLLEHWGK